VKVEFLEIYQIFPERFEPLYNSRKIQNLFCSRIFNLQFLGNLKLGQKGKLCLVLQAISMQSLVNFVHQEGHCFEF
jgi:hypothetical protein